MAVKAEKKLHRSWSRDNDRVPMQIINYDLINLAQRLFSISRNTKTLRPSDPRTCRRPSDAGKKLHFLQYQHFFSITIGSRNTK